MWNFGVVAHDILVTAYSPSSNFLGLGLGLVNIEYSQYGLNVIDVPLILEVIICSSRCYF